jgi:hypothetical protein
MEEVAMSTLFFILALIGIAFGIAASVMTGEPGPLFYWFIASWNLALVFAIVGIIFEVT